MKSLLVSISFIALLLLSSCGDEGSTKEYLSDDAKMKLTIYGSQAIALDPYQLDMKVSCGEREKEFALEAHVNEFSEETVKVNFISNSEIILDITEQDGVKRKISITCGSDFVNIIE